MKNILWLFIMLLIPTESFAIVCETTVNGKCHLSTGVVTYKGQTSPNVSPSGQGRMYFDVTEGVFKCSENGGAYVDCVGGDTSGFVLSTGDTMTGDLNVPTEVYGAGWNGSTEVPTKDAVYDKVETISASSPWTDAGTVVHPGSATDDVAVGGTSSTAPIFIDESTETIRANGGYITGDGTDKSMTVLTMDLSDGDQVIAWNETNHNWDFSAPINASGTGPSSIGQGLTINDGGGGSDDDDFIVESDTEDQFLKLDASANVFRIGDFDTNYTQFSTTGAITQAGSATLTLQDGSDFIITANANAGPYLANSGDTGTGAFDFGGADSVEIPNAAAPTVNAAGEIAVDTTDDQLKFYGGAERVLTYKKTFNIALETPADADSFLFHKAIDGYTMTAINCAVDPADTGESAVIDIRECDSTGDNCSTVDATITCDNDGAADDGSLTNPSIDSGDWMLIDIGTVTGTVTILTVTGTYTITAE